VARAIQGPPRTGVSVASYRDLPNGVAPPETTLQGPHRRDGAGLLAPEGAPNVLLIMTDDVAFGASSTLTKKKRLDS
jgi:hypothetical protein